MLWAVVVAILWNTLAFWPLPKADTGKAWWHRRAWAGWGTQTGSGRSLTFSPGPEECPTVFHASSLVCLSLRGSTGDKAWVRCSLLLWHHLTPLLPLSSYYATVLHSCLSRSCFDLGRRREKIGRKESVWGGSFKETKLLLWNWAH